MDKKIKLSMLAGVVALAIGSQAFAAAPTAELKVTGSLDVPGCTVTADNNGVYDFGIISPSQIKPGTAVTALTPISQNWDISCSGSTYLTFKVIDNQAASSSIAGANNFGMGMVNNTGKLGYYQVLMNTASVDGTNASVFATTGTTFTSVASTAVYSGAYTMGWANASNALIAGKDFKTTIRVSPFLAGTTTMNGPITSDTDLDGSLTLNFAFGL